MLDCPLSIDVLCHAMGVELSSICLDGENRVACSRLRLWSADGNYKIQAIGLHPYLRKH